MRRSLAVQIIAFLLIPIAVSFGQWSDDPTVNTIINRSANDQLNPKIIGDGAGGAIIVWQDFRNGSDFDIYAQRINSSGYPQWLTVVGRDTLNLGRPICTASGNQTTPVIVGDGQGGAFISWQDSRSGNSNIYIQRINGSGTVLWPTDGIPLCTEASEQVAPSIATDDAGGAIVAWYDHRNGNDDIYAERISGSGTLQWTTNGVPVCTATGDQTAPRIAKDGFSGVYVTWLDFRNGVDDNIYAQRLTASTGAPLWRADGISICTSTGHQRNPAIINDGTNDAIITWQDYRNGKDYDIYAQRIAPDSSKLWGVNGAWVSKQTGDQINPTLVPDQVGGAVIAWQDYRNSVNYDIYAQRMTPGGVKAWMAPGDSNGIAVSQGNADQTLPFAISDGIGGAIVTWQDYRNGPAADIYARRISPTGSILWGPVDIGISTAAGDQQLPVGTGDGTQGAFIVWQDYRSGATADIYAQNVNYNGVIGLNIISGTVYRDRNNNGIPDTGEPGLPGWRVRLTGPVSGIDTTDANGAYQFTGLIPGIYTVAETDSNGRGWNQTDPPGLFYTISIDSAGDDTSGVDFGNYRLPSIRGRLFNDLANDTALAGDAGLNGWVVRLYKGGIFQQRLTTAGAGDYIFLNLNHGTYTVEESLAVGWSQTYPRRDSPNVVGTVYGQYAGPWAYSVMVPSDTIDTAVVGMHFANFARGRISGRVWKDNLGDSVITYPGPPGTSTDDTVQQGWVVKLYRNGLLEQRTVTTSQGVYIFDTLAFGVYTVEESLMTHWGETYPTPRTPGTTTSTYGENAGGRAFRVAITTSGQVTANLDFGNFQFALVTGRLVDDLRADSLVKLDSLPSAYGYLDGWTILVWKDSTLRFRTTSSDSGDYTFWLDGLGLYVVQESLQGEWTQSYPRFPKLGDTSLSIDSVTRTRSYKVLVNSSGMQFPKTNFGNIHVRGISGMVFNDHNHNGTLDSGEAGIPSWKISLTGKRITMQKYTDAGGSYAFSGLDTGSYVIQQIPQAGWLRTFPAHADTYRVHLNKGQTVGSRDFGLYPFSSISGYVFENLNGDSLKDLTEPGIASWQVVLRQKSTGVFIDSTRTDSTGKYAFHNLPLDEYLVAVTMQEGWKVSPPLMSSTFDVVVSTPATITNLNFGFFKLGIVTGTVFGDANGDGVLALPEAGIPGIQLTLSWRANDSLIMTAMTDSSGQYTIRDLDTGSYVLRCLKPLGMMQTSPKPTPTYTISFTSSSKVFGSKNFGLLEWNTLSGTIFNDKNGNGRLNPGEPGLGGLTVTLSNVDSTYKDTTRSAENGIYQFTGLATGIYLVTLQASSGYAITLPNPTGSYVLQIDSNGQDITGKNYGCLATMFSGTVYNNLNGDAVKDKGEPPLAGWRVTMRNSSSGALIASALSGSDGSYQLSGFPPGSYTVAESLQAGWIKTIPSTPTYAVTVDSAHTVFTLKDFGNFRATTISGISFEDINRNGVQDPGESFLTTWIVRLYRDTVKVDSVYTNASGAYSFSNLSPGTYNIKQELKSGWRRSLPLAPGYYTFPLTSGTNLTNLNFANYQNLPNCITVRKFIDQDGKFSTRSDGSPKPWFLNLYKSTPTGDSLIGNVIRSNSSIIGNGLPAGTYFAREADSAGWVSIGKIRDSVAIAGNYRADTVTLSAGGSRSVDFVNFRPNRILVKKFTDADGRFSTADDRTGAPWPLSVYKNFIAPGNLLGTVASAESLVISSLPDGTFQVVEADSTGWKHLGIITNGIAESSAAASKQITLSGGIADTVLFVNSPVGNLIVHSLKDDDGDYKTASDQSFKTWNLMLYRDSLSTLRLLQSVNAESLLAAGLDTGNYVIISPDSTSWTRVVAIVDGNDTTGARDTVSLSIGKGESHDVEFVNFYNRQKKVWTAAADAQWNNRRNWDPAYLPVDGDSVTIAATARPAVPTLPGDASLRSFTIDKNAGIAIRSPLNLNLVGDLTVNGSLVIDTASPTITIGGNYSQGGLMRPGRSTFAFTATSPQVIGSSGFFNLVIGTGVAGRSKAHPPKGILSSAVVRTNGNITVDSVLTLNSGLDAGADTVILRNGRYSALDGIDEFVQGTLQRAILPDTQHAYSFGNPNTYIQFRPSAVFPTTITMGIFPATDPFTAGRYWQTRGGTVDTALNRILIDSVRSFVDYTACTFGNDAGANGQPRVRRFYRIQADADTGYVSLLSLHYESGEITPGFNETLLQLLRKQYSVAVPIEAGWNMVSVPVIPPDFRTSVLFPVAVSPTFEYVMGDGYVEKETLEVSKGYWIKLDTIHTVDIPGTARLVDTVSLDSGWNMIGSLSIPVPASSISTLPDGIIQSPIYGYKKGYFVADDVMPMKAFWVKAYQKGKAVLSKPSADPLAKKNPNAALRVMLNRLNALVIRDQRGNGQTLYFGVRSQPGEPALELPPTPPRGVFDVRFAKGTSVTFFENKGTATAPITVSSASYPLTLRWDLKAGDIPACLLIGDKEVALTSGGSLEITDPSLAIALRLGEKPAMPVRFSLEQNYPNPFNPTTTIRYSVPVPAHVTVLIYNILGQKVRTLIDEVTTAGTKSIIWNSTNDYGLTVASGIYFYRFEGRSISDKGNSFSQIKKMLLIK